MKSPTPEVLREREEQRRTARLIREARVRREREAEARAAREHADAVELAQLSDEELESRRRQANEMLGNLDILEAGGFL